MNMRQVISELSRRGYRVTYYNRKDGGVRITSINGLSFKGSEGNAYARNIVGVTLSIRRARQLQSKPLRTPKGQFGHKRKAPLPKTIISKLRRAQRIWRESGIKSEEKPTAKNIRYNLKTYGEAETIKRLEQNERYARGLAYDENINAFIDRLKQDKVNANTLEREVLDRIILLIETNRATLRDEVLVSIYEATYLWEKNQKSINDLEADISTLLNK